MSDLVVKPKREMTLRDRLETPEVLNNLAKAVPSHIKADFFARVAATALLKAPKLKDCTPESFFEALYTSASLGLPPDGRNAHLIPYGTKCTLLLDYKGLVQLVIRSGEVLSVMAQDVCEHDDFRWSLGELTHTIDWRRDRGEPFAWYALAVMKDGTKRAEVMTRKEIEAVRKRSRSANDGPWVTDFGEMAKKTVFRRLSKWLPVSSEIVQKALDVDDQTFREVVAEPPQPVFSQQDALPAVQPVAVIQQFLDANGIQFAQFKQWLSMTNLYSEPFESLTDLPESVVALLFADNETQLKKCGTLYGRKQ